MESYQFDPKSLLKKPQAKTVVLVKELENDEEKNGDYLPKQSTLVPFTEDELQKRTLLAIDPPSKRVSVLITAEEKYIVALINKLDK